MTSIAMRPNQLPLLGSNQDSPDPESGEARPFRGVAVEISGGNTPEARPKPHENTHDFTHDEPRYEGGEG